GKRLKQVLLNLLNNSLKYTEKGEIQLIVRLERSAFDSQEQLVFDVTDTGFGIPPAQISRIFDPFYQGESSPQKREGVGLGLALVRSYSKLLGAEVRVDSKEGKGSTFSIYLKLKSVRQNSWLTNYKLSEDPTTT